MLLILSAISAIAATGWYRARVQLHESRMSELSRIAGLLEEDQELLRTLHRESTTLRSLRSSMHTNLTQKPQPNYPEAQLPLPAEFAAAIDAEMRWAN